LSIERLSDPEKHPAIKLTKDPTKRSMSSKSKSEPQQQQIDLSSLTSQNLTAVKKQLDEELEHLTASFQKLRAAQARFRECIKSVKDGVETQTEGIGFFLFFVLRI